MGHLGGLSKEAAERTRDGSDQEGIRVHRN